MRRTLSILGLVTAALVSVGLIVLASAGGQRADALYGDPFHFFKSQVMWLGIALAFMAAAIFVDYRQLKKRKWIAIALFAAVIVLLAGVFAFKPVNGSYRWIDLRKIGLPMRLQPSEIGKLATVLCVSVWLDRIGWRVEQFVRGALVPCLMFGAVVALLVKEPDFGSSMVVLSAGLTLMFLAGTKLWQLALLGGGFVGAVGTFVALNQNRVERVMAWLNGNEGGGKTSDAAYQLNQAIIAITRGGLGGVGYNQSMQKQFYLPEAHTDFIFAVGAEEFGLVFSLVVLLLYVGVFACGMYVSMHAPDRLGRLLAFGMTFLIVVQAVVNIGVVTGCLPTKGLALPLISYGGTNLISALVAIGVVMNVGLAAIRAERTRTPRVVPPPRPAAA